MRRVLLRRAPLAVLVSLIALVVLLAAPVDRELVLRIYALVVGGLALATLTAATGFATRRRPSQFAAALRRKPVRFGRPEELERLERQVALSIENAADFHFRLRRTLVAAADAAVWRRHGVSLEQGADLMPARLWAVVRPDCEPPADRRAAGPSLEEVSALVDEIERMAPS
jgi:hypothetical protein